MVLRTRRWRRRTGCGCNRRTTRCRFWAFDQFCLNSRPVPLQAWVQSCDGGVYHKPRAARAVETPTVVDVVVARWRRVQFVQGKRGEAQWLTILVPSTARRACISPVDAFSGEAPGDDRYGRGPDRRLHDLRRDHHRRLRRDLRRPLDRRRARRVHRQDRHAVHRVPAWGVRDRRRRPQQRRGGEGEHGRGLHHRAPVRGPGHRERGGHGRRPQLCPEGRRGHNHRPQDVPGWRGVRLGHEGEHRPGTPAQCWRDQVEEAGQLGRPRDGAQREQPPRDGRHHRLRGGPDLRRVLVSGRHDRRQGHRPDRRRWRAGRRGRRRLARGHRRHSRHLYQDHRGSEGARHGWRGAPGWRPAVAHPCGVRYHVRIDAVRDQEGRRRRWAPAAR